MQILNIIEENINDRYIDMVVNTLRDGGIVIYPTDTIYAIGCDALNNSAIEKVCAIKAMKSAKTNLTIICHEISQITEYAKFGNREFKVIKQYLPGPYTFIFPALSKLPKAFKGRRTVGIRIPDNAIACKIVEKLGRPILSTSVEADDADYMCEPELIAENYAASVDLVIDAGRGGTTPSTIVDCTTGDFEVTREGKGEFEA
ncbi:MAG: L-threonylcarbamoyladenylate synthase [Bacteroidales bacterium]|nr:L-threonylcarbamoyladenylate synthase [Bacteroidales bacterium]